MDNEKEYISVVHCEEREEIQFLTHCSKDFLLASIVGLCDKLSVSEINFIMAKLVEIQKENKPDDYKDYLKFINDFIN